MSIRKVFGMITLFNFFNLKRKQRPQQPRNYSVSNEYFNKYIAYLSNVDNEIINYENIISSFLIFV